jgi:hypothetical protein
MWQVSFVTNKLTVPKIKKREYKNFAGNHPTFALLSMKSKEL